MQMTTRDVWRFIRPFERAKLNKLGVKYIIQEIVFGEEYFHVKIIFKSGKEFEFQGELSCTHLYTSACLGHNVSTVGGLTKEMVS